MLTTPIYLPIAAMVVSLTFAGLWLCEKNKNKKLRNFNTDVTERLIRTRLDYTKLQKESGRSYDAGSTYTHSAILAILEKELYDAKINAKRRDWEGRIARERIHTLKDIIRLIEEKTK